MAGGADIGRTRLYRIVLAFTLLGYAWVGWSLIAAHSDGPAGAALPAPCFFKAVTGLPCPSCGTTRAVERLAEGDLAGSLATNPLGLLLAAGGLIIPPWVLADLLRKRDGFHRFYLSIGGVLGRSRPAAFACIALTLANWGWNFVKGF